MQLEAHRSANKADAQARLREAHLAGIEPAEDHLTRQARAWEGDSNSGVARVGAGLAVAPNRIVAAVERAAAQHEAEGRPAHDLLSPDERREAAALYRAQAAELERGT